MKTKRNLFVARNRFCDGNEELYIVVETMSEAVDKARTYYRRALSEGDRVDNVDEPDSVSFVVYDKHLIL